MSYSEKLRDPRWQKKRLEVMAAANWSCQACGDAKETLNVHHAFYVRGRDPWEYEIAELVCLCEPCHEDDHARRNDLFRSLLALDAYNGTWMRDGDTQYPSSGTGLRQTLGYVHGLLLRCGIVAEI